MASGYPSPPPYPLQVLEGTIDRLTFQNEQNVTRGALIPKASRPRLRRSANRGANPGRDSPRPLSTHRSTVAVRGPLTCVRCRPPWRPPTYLGSASIRSGSGDGGGWCRLSVEAMDIIEESPERLREVPGIGERRSSLIVNAWEEQRQIKDLMLFLQSHGVSTGLAVRIYRQYRDESASVVRSAPYRLAREVFGIGFKTADKIARNLGISADDPARVQAGLLYSLSSLSDEGHCFALREQLLEQAGQLLELEPETGAPPLRELVAAGEVIAEDDAVYLPPFCHAETGVATRVRRLQTAALDRLGAFATVDWPRAFEWLDRSSTMTLTEQQKRAIRMALTERVSVLTGGPGTGKSTIVGGVIGLARTQGRSVVLAAPTGRAAKRLTETTGMEAKTIHRLLEFQPTAGYRFQRDRDNPLEADIVIVDEVSMVDVLLMNHLLGAIPPGGHLLLVGDVDQLPSVGAGNVLRDLIESEVVPTTRLDTIFRQAENSHIIYNAHRINRGEMPVFDRGSRDFFLFRESDADKAADWVVDLVSERIPRRFRLDPLEDIQVLAPMHRGSAGVGALNERLQAVLNPPGSGRAERVHGSRTFRTGDRVMQTRNDYDRQIYNGDQGRVAEVDLEEGILVVSFDGRPVAYDYAQLDELVHAYAVSIHKSQGSEYPAVVVPILTQHYVMLQRNLLYTAVTRARELVVLVGDRRAIAIAVRNNRVVSRNTRLAERLRAMR